MREIKFRFLTPEKRIIEDHDGWIEGIGINEALNCSKEYGYIIMQYTGLKDKNGSGHICLYEGDIISSSGELLGNKYESPNLLEDKTNLVIEGIGTKTWVPTEKEAMVRGFGYAE